jgi:hypothetical protein
LTLFCFNAHCRCSVSARIDAVLFQSALPLFCLIARCRNFPLCRRAGHVTVEYQGEAMVRALFVFECALPVNFVQSALPLFCLFKCALPQFSFLQTSWSRDC